MPLNSPCLWVVATPLGNTGDFSPRARETLINADVVLAEDTRRANNLFRDLGIEVKKLSSFFDHNEKQKLSAILDVLRKGANVALISDAGTPLLADPGYRLVCACQKEGIKVSPIPGPSAPTSAISVAGIAPIPFAFLGFLPRGIKDRKDIFSAYASTPGSLVFFERADRLEHSLAIALAILSDRELAICRELTKTWEEIIRGRLADYQTLALNLRGEITVVIGQPEIIAKSPEFEVQSIYSSLLETGIKPREAAKKTASQCTGWSVSDVYRLVSDRS